MKKFNFLFVGLLAISVFLVNCKKESHQEAAKKAEFKQEQISQAKLDQVRALSPNQMSPDVAISYLGSLCHGVTVSGSQTGSTIGNSANWDYYSFCGRAGDVVTIYAARTGNCFMDPAMSLFFGTTNDNTGVSPDNGGPNMTFLASADDNTPRACGASCFHDPTIGSFTLPSTGTYTVAVFNFFSCTPDPVSYDLTFTVNSYASLVIGGCDTGVPNASLGCCGNSMSDAIAACKVGAKNHGAYVSCAAQLTGSWVTAGMITSAQKDAIMSCVAKNK